MPKKQTNVTYQFEDTKGDGNCLFNALVLGICNESVFKHLEANLAQDELTADIAYADFIKRAAAALKVAATWEAVKQAILKLRATRSGSEELQVKLAPVMRHIGVARLAAKTAEQYKLRAKYREEVAYQQYKAAKKIDPTTPHQENPYTPELQRQLVRAFDKYPDDKFDDIFTRLPFIVEKFKELKNAAGNQKDKVRALKEWWQQHGFHQYIDKMNQSGEFGGDADGKEVVDDFLYLNWDVIALERYSSDQPTRLHSAHGKLSLPTLTYVQARELGARRVTEGAGSENVFAHNKTLPWMENTEEGLNAALSAVPNHAEVKAYFEQEHLKANVPGTAERVLDKWKTIPNCIEQLQLRGIVMDGKFVVDSSNPAGLKNILQRIDAIPDKDQIIAKWKEKKGGYRAAMTITSSNPHAVHWSNVVVIEAKAALTSTTASTPAQKASEKAVVLSKGKEEEAVQQVVLFTEEKKAAAAQAFFTNTLKYVTTDSAKPSEKRWQAIVDKATREAANPTVAKKGLDYALANAVKLMKPSAGEKIADSIKVSEDTQKALDAELAKELQQQEYMEYLSTKRTPRG